METNTGLWVGLGVLCVLIIASLGSETDTQAVTKPTEEPKTEPKKVQL